MKHRHNEHIGALSELSAALQVPLQEVTAIYSAELERLADSENDVGVVGMLALRNTCLRLRDRIQS